MALLTRRTDRAHKINRRVLRELRYAVYDWTGWEAERDLGNADDRFGVWYLTIRADEQEYAVIIHRTDSSTEPPSDAVAAQKMARAQRMVDALNETPAGERSTGWEAGSG